MPNSNNLSTKPKPVAPWLRFLLSGGLNTALTYTVYLLLLPLLSYTLAYSAAFALGLVWAYLLNRHFVFRQHRGLLSVLSVPLIYLVQYGLGLGLLWLWIDWAGFDPRLGPLFVAAASVPVSYWLSKKAFT